MNVERERNKEEMSSYWMRERLNYLTKLARESSGTVEVDRDLLLDLVELAKIGSVAIRRMDTRHEEDRRLIETWQKLEMVRYTRDEKERDPIFNDVNIR